MEFKQKFKSDALKREYGLQTGVMNAQPNEYLNIGSWDLFLTVAAVLKYQLVHNRM